MSIQDKRTHQERRKAWIGLTLLPGWGPLAVWEAVGQSKDPVPAWRAQRPLLNEHTPAQVLAYAKEQNIRVVTWDDDLYPANLRRINSPPPVLYYRGSLAQTDNAAVAMVGSRRASPQAIQVARKLAYALAQQGITIVSGLAVGIDTAAHQGALAGGGRTLAVLGCGADIIYPRSNKNLAQQIIEQGALLSQFQPRVPPRAGHFPIRNRTMVGLTLGTVVVEARKNSGALITARLALTTGHKVFICPNDISREHALGSNGLLQEFDRALHVVLSADDIVKGLYAELKDCVTAQIASPQPLGLAAFTTNLPAEQKDIARSLWHLLSEGPSSADELALRLRIPCSGIRSCLSMLETMERVKKYEGDRYILS